MDAALQYLQTLQGLPAYGLVLGLLVACGIGAPMSEDLVLLIAAALTLTGVMDPLPLIAVAWVGVITGDALVFHWGHRYGARLWDSRNGRRLMPPGRLLALQDRVRRSGPFSLFMFRFVPGIRTALFFAAGSLKLPYRQLLLFDGAAALIELPLLVYSVRFVGGRWHEILALFERFQGAVVVTLLGVVGAWMLLGWRRARAGKRAPVGED